MTKARVLLIVGLLLCAKPGFAGPLSFESGNLAADGWGFAGLVDVVTTATIGPSATTFGPSDGNYFALLESGPRSLPGGGSVSGATALELDLFFGFDAGYLATQGYTGGSAVGRTVHMEANEIGQFDFVFVSDDPFNDAGLFVLDGNGNLVHQFFIISDDTFPEGHTEPWLHYNDAFMALSEGNYFVGVGVLNRQDTTGTSYLAVDNFKVTDTGEAVPEPATLLLLSAGAGTAFVARRLRRRRSPTV